MTYFAAAEAGAAVVDCALSPFSGGTSQPPTESVVFGFAKTPWIRHGPDRVQAADGVFQGSAQEV
jgi:pyruvate/oxaloacetate carboxyltransferase